MHLLREASLLPDSSDELTLCSLLDLDQLCGLNRATHPILSIHTLAYLMHLHVRLVFIIKIY